MMAALFKERTSVLVKRWKEGSKKQSGETAVGEDHSLLNITHDRMNEERTN
jgi:hypothetical protein